MRAALAILALALLPALAAADTLYVTEFQGAPQVSVYFQAARAPATAKQTVAISGTSTQSAAFAIDTGLVRIATDVACVVEIGGTSPVATSTSMRLAAGQTEYFVVLPGDRVAVKTP